LSFIGEPFEYDIFVSYAHADAETEAPDMHLWSRYVAERLRDGLAAALNSGDPTSAVKVFLDDRVLRSGDPLTETLREKVQRSALLIVMMSPLYPKKMWCLDELKWFFAQAAQDGRGQRHCTVLRIQLLHNTAWPKQLKDERGNPVVFRDFADSATGLPQGLDDREAPALKSAIRDTHIELLKKLKELRAQREARRDYQQQAVVPEPVQPVLYLHAQPQELPQWVETRTELEPRAIVHPDSLPEPAADDSLQQRQSEQRLREYTWCDGIVLLRAGAPDELLRIEVMAAYKDRQRLYQQRHRNIPWAIVDRLGDAPPVYSAYRVPCVAAAGQDWPDRLVRTLGLKVDQSP
jgi:hypothetical protein